MTKFALLVPPLLLAGCSIVIGGRPDVCGVYPEGGGPAEIQTRDQELCEVVRLRITNGLASLSVLSEARLEQLVQKTDSWENLPSIERLVEELREEAGEGFAIDVQRAVDAVAEQSKRSITAECAANEQRCMVKGAVRGLRIALMNAEAIEPPGEEPGQKRDEVY